MLRVLNAGLAASRGVTVDFDDVTLASAHLRRDLIEGVLGLVVQRGLAGTEADFNVVHFLILVESGNSGVQLAVSALACWAGLLQPE